MHGGYQYGGVQYDIHGFTSITIFIHEEKAVVASLNIGERHDLYDECFSPPQAAVPLKMAGSTMNHDTLKQRHRLTRDAEPTNLRVRIHRSLSWLKRAEQADDQDGRFIFLWIAFNAAYGCAIDEQYRLSEQSTFKAFLEKLCGLDNNKRIDSLVWKEFSGSIRLLLDNPFVFETYWDFQRGKISEAEWKERFDKGKRIAQSALASGNTPTLLGVIFNRIYTLRNQLIHGGATWNGSINRDQLRDCTKLLGKLVPLFIELMMGNPNTSWGDVNYPMVKG